MPLTVQTPYRQRDDGEVVPDSDLVPVGEFLVPDRFSLVYKPTGNEPGWRMDFAVRDGAPRCRRLVVEATEDGRENRSVDLRGLSVEDLTETAAGNFATRRVVDEHGQEHIVSEIDDVYSGATVRNTRKARRAARRKITDDVLREVAEIYRANVGDSPTEAVRLHLGVADRTARLWVRRARDAGYLGASLRGKAGES